MPAYYCQLGNTPSLSIQEITALVNHPPSRVNSSIVEIELADDTQAQDLQKRAGGIVKILKPVGTTNSDRVMTDLAQVLIRLQIQSDAKINFGITSFTSTSISLDTIKKELAQHQLKSRYLRSSQEGLSAAVLLHHQVIELYLLPTTDKSNFTIAHTITVQNIDDWSKRDRSKPYANRRKGMLPPKVARMMVNVARQLVTAETNQPLIYDPFCGTGTILMEAMMTGLPVLGSDLDQDSVAGSIANLTWLAENYDLTTDFKIKHHDVTQPLSLSSKVDAIVTEPFLGKPTPNPAKLANIFTGLHRLYLGAFKNWTQLLKPGAVVVIIFPFAQAKKTTYQLQKLIDKLPSLGYTTISEPIIYSRPQAVIHRSIQFLRYKG